MLKEAIIGAVVSPVVLILSPLLLLILVVYSLSLLSYIIFDEIRVITGLREVEEWELRP